MLILRKKEKCLLLMRLLKQRSLHPMKWRRLICKLKLITLQSFLMQNKLLDSGITSTMKPHGMLLTKMEPLKITMSGQMDFLHTRKTSGTRLKIVRQTGMISKRMKKVTRLNMKTVITISIASVAGKVRSMPLVLHILGAQ